MLPFDHTIYRQKVQVSLVFTGDGDLPFSTYAPRGRWGGGEGQAPYTFPMRITCKKGEGVHIECKIVYVINGRPHLKYLFCCDCSFKIMGGS